MVDHHPKFQKYCCEMTDNKKTSIRLRINMSTSEVFRISRNVLVKYIKIEVIHFLQFQIHFLKMILKKADFTYRFPTMAFVHKNEIFMNTSKKSMRVRIMIDDVIILI